MKLCHMSLLPPYTYTNRTRQFFLKYSSISSQRLSGQTDFTSRSASLREWRASYFLWRRGEGCWKTCLLRRSTRTRMIRQAGEPQHQRDRWRQLRRCLHDNYAGAYTHVPDLFWTRPRRTHRPKLNRQTFSFSVCVPSPANSIRAVYNTNNKDHQSN